MTTRILAISGSLRFDSVNTALLRAAAAVSADDTWVELWCGLGAIPPFNEDGEHDTPAAVADMRAAIAGADALLISTPEYNGSIPGQLKNALDWVSRPLADSPFRGKPTAVIGASTSTYGAMWAQAELRKVLGLMGARVIESGLAVPHAEDHLDEEGRLLDPDMRDRLAGVVAELKAAATVAAPVAA
jgi:chromate reductase, NAD(P)H dehydrogenase (quinone)